MNINQIKRVLENENIWYSVLCENDDIDIDEVTTIPHICSEMYKKLFVLTTGNVQEAEKAVSDWKLFANVVLDTECTKYLSRLSSYNLILVGKNDIGRAIGALNEAVRNR